MPDPRVRVVGRYALYNAIAAGGMATVHLGRLLGPVGFSRTVAIKRLHAQFASDPEFVSMFLDEARLAARIRHPNVVPTLDVVATGGELFLVMDYVPGESLARLSRALRTRQQGIPLRILSATMSGVLHGLHAAHEAKDERGDPLGIVHRDVSPQNVLLGTDGAARVLDFGVAKAAGRMQTTKDGQIKGKLSYMPPEQLRGVAVTRKTDIYAVGVMLWELLTGDRLFAGDHEGEIVARVLEGKVTRPSEVLVRSGRISPADPAMKMLQALDATILRAIDMNTDVRFATAREMAIELERRCPPATASECGDWVEHVARDVLSSRAAMVAEIESGASMMSDEREGHVRSVLNTPPGGGFALPATEPGPGSNQLVTGPHLAIPRGPHPPIDGPPVTQPSSISVSSAALGLPRQYDTNSRSVVLGVLVGIFMTSIVLVSAVLYRQSRIDAAELSTEEPPSLSATPSATVALPDVAPSTSLSAPTAEVTPPPIPSATASVELVVDAGAHRPHANPATASHAGGGKSVKVGPVPKQSGTTTAPRVDDCATPFYYDSSGTKRYKPQCLGGK
ncbi:MAG TPA: protein kinase [Labilithrix sp.]|nr:protein kinase [Labilithrix sp.]